jgi:hypothetical protein
LPQRNGPRFHSSDKRIRFVCLKFNGRESNCSSMVEKTTGTGCLFEPASYGIPGNSRYTSNRSLVSGELIPRSNFTLCKSKSTA